MTFVKWVSNVDSRDRAARLTFDRTDGSRGEIFRGRSYELTADEINRLNRWAVFGPGEASSEPVTAPSTEPVYLDPTTGRIPVDKMPVGSGVRNPRGPWNSGLDIKRLDEVSFLNSSYAALQDIPPGGQSPAVDTASWMLIAGGVGDIAGPAEVTANYAPTLAVGLFDVPGASIVIPAGAGPYEVSADVPAIQIIFGASATASSLGTVRLFLVDEHNVVLNASFFRTPAGGPNAVLWGQGRVKKRMPATAVAKTIKLSGWLDSVTNIASVTLWAGPGTSTPPSTSSVGPISIVATPR